MNFLLQFQLTEDLMRIVSYQRDDKPSKCCPASGDDNDRPVTVVNVVLPSTCPSHLPSSSFNICSTSWSFCYSRTSHDSCSGCRQFLKSLSLSSSILSGLQLHYTFIVFFLIKCPGAFFARSATGLSKNRSAI